MKHYLFLFALVCFAFGVNVPPIYGQSPWVAPQNGPNFVWGGNYFNTIISSPQPNMLAGRVYFFASRAGSNCNAFVTTDNGITWQQQVIASTVRVLPGFSEVGTYAVDMFMLDGQHMWLLSRDAATNAQSLLRTTTGLAGLVALPNPPPASFSHIHFFNPNVGLALANAPLRIFRTVDGGSTWNLLPNVTLTGSLALYPFTTFQGASNTVWIFTDNAMLRTTDAGLTWTTATIPNGFQTVAFENTLQGLGYTDASVRELFRTTDGGLTWTRVPNGSQPTSTSITAMPNQPGTYLRVGYTGIFALTRDGGNTWQTMSTDGSNFYMVAASSPSHIWAGSYEWGSSSRPGPPLLRYVGTALATKKSATPALSILVYPNPSTGLVQLAGPLTGKETARVYDVAGQLCQQGFVSDAQRTLDLSAQAPGLYLLKLTAPDGTIRTQRLSKLP
ncbi:T9SS type A sorting domain-containing protein [Hymenobacter sp. BT186]|uniref:T9SS type A sorting domain-containing protein n=1 Tax=Hymenobacter telluris TaxID=2816474 RepID=A0A939JDA8_9BACT|nr:T9SS type A sorting domain-containing protein [Hymenobacter telluris]MBO0358152.1 T9SS type A sorting domain-containing protein [Hymenobacter telluris]MBW3374179.1 T9SS type A sorting domain-containing protein [Hymenobacter norwichensis]